MWFCYLNSVLYTCLLYTSDAADERSSVDLGGRRIIKKKKNENLTEYAISVTEQSQSKNNSTNHDTNNKIKKQKQQ